MSSPPFSPSEAANHLSEIAHKLQEAKWSSEELTEVGLTAEYLAEVRRRMEEKERESGAK